MATANRAPNSCVRYNITYACGHVSHFDAVYQGHRHSDICLCLNFRQIPTNTTFVCLRCERSEITAAAAAAPTATRQQQSNDAQSNSDLVAQPFAGGQGGGLMLTEGFRRGNIPVATPGYPTGDGVDGHDQNQIENPARGEVRNGASSVPTSTLTSTTAGQISYTPAMHQAAWHRLVEMPPGHGQHPPTFPPTLYPPMIPSPTDPRRLVPNTAIPPSNVPMLGPGYGSFAEALERARRMAERFATAPAAAADRVASSQSSAFEERMRMVNGHRSSESSSSEDTQTGAEVQQE